jgi:hypothetical protein
MIDIFHRFYFRLVFWLLFNVVVPIPPRETYKVPEVILEEFKEVKPLPFTDNVPVLILEAFKLVNEAPEPVNVLAVIYVADIVVPVKDPMNDPADNGKKIDNVEDNVVPFLFISLQFIVPKTSNL